MPALLRARSAAVVAAIGFSIGAFALAPASAAAASLPEQGLYEGCAPYEPQPECANRLTQIGQAGFQLVLNYSAWYGNEAQVQAYAAEAQNAGVKLIWPLDASEWRDSGSANSLLSTYSTLAPTCGCSNNAGFITYAINLVKSLPATWGYYIGDELGPSQASAVAALAAAVRQVDPSHPLLYVGLASPTLTTDLQPFESIANFVGADSYPIGSGGSTADVGAVAHTVEDQSRASGTGRAMVLQSFDWSEYPGTQSAPPSWPTEAQMQSMRDEALAADPSLILWYSFYDIERSDNPAGHWQDLVQAAFAPVPTATGSGSGSPGAHTARAHRRSHRKVRAGAASLKHHRRRRHRRRHHRRRHHQLHHRAQDVLVASPLASLDALLRF